MAVYYDYCAWCGRELNSGSIYRSRTPYCGERCRRAALAAEREDKEREQEERMRIAKQKRENEAARELARKADRNRWYASEWVDHLINHPEDVSQCKWKNFCADDYVRLFLRHPSLAGFVPEKVDWKLEMGDGDWICLLMGQPKLINNCDDYLEPEELKKVLKNNPALIESCNLKQLSLSAWANLLRAAPRLADECSVWGEFTDSHWAWILAVQPKFLSRCPNIDKLGGEPWAEILLACPSMCARCDFSKFDIGDWVHLLKGRPEFVDRFNLWTDDVVDDVKLMIDEVPVLAEVFDWARLEKDGFFESLERHGVSRSQFDAFVGKMSVHAWLRLYHWCSWHAYRDWKEYPPNLDECDIGELCDLVIFNAKGNSEFWRKIVKNVGFSNSQKVEIIYKFPQWAGDVIDCSDLSPADWGAAIGRNFDLLESKCGVKNYSANDCADFLIAYRGDDAQVMRLPMWKSMSEVPPEKWLRLALASRVYAKKINWRKFDETFDGWDRFSPSERVELIWAVPIAVKYFDEKSFLWDALDAQDWVDLCRYQYTHRRSPNFVEHCNVFAINWGKVRYSQEKAAMLVFGPPNMVDVISDEEWRSISPAYWKEILKCHPELKPYRRKYEVRDHRRKCSVRRIVWCAIGFSLLCGVVALFTLFVGEGAALITTRVRDFLQQLGSVAKLVASVFSRVWPVLWPFAVALSLSKYGLRSYRRAFKQSRVGRKDFLPGLIFSAAVWYGLHEMARVWDVAKTFVVFYKLSIILPCIILLVKRVHDIGRTAWWLLLLLMPYVCPAVLCFLIFWPGERGSNKFGDAV